MSAEKVDPMNKNPNDYSLILFDRDLTEWFNYVIQTLEEACEMISNRYKDINKDKEFDKKAILNIIMLKNLSQYVEALIAYCLACQKDNSGDFIDTILKYNGGQISNFIKKIEKLSDAELDNILSFCDSSYWLSEQNKDQIEMKMKKSRNELRSMLTQLKSFWDTYHDFYNASKHGGRWWMKEISQIDCEEEERGLGIQWFQKDGSVKTEVKKLEELNDMTMNETKKCKRIMEVLSHNRKLLWTSAPFINQDEYLYID